MPDSKIKQVVDSGEQVIRLLRDAVIGVVFLCLVAAPKFVGQRLKDAGFTKFDRGGITWEADLQKASDKTKDAAATVSGATQTLQDAIASLNVLSSQTHEANVRDGIQKQISQMNSALGNVQVADDSLKESLLTQQTLLAQSKPNSSPSTQQGWIFVGKIDEDKRGWVSGSPKNILPIGWPIKAGQTIVVSGLSYLRDDSDSHSHSGASVVTVLKDRTKLVVESVDDSSSHAIGGGWFVWVKTAAPADSTASGN